ncbi:MAG: YgdI/YgdR family lipoprotein [Lachnospiraceae bacterium]|nr:YgdI/YgdR family lipoprotein [Lachnospiraceae bacterium]
MKKTICIFLAGLMVLGLAACGSAKQEATADEGFAPRLDKS